MNHSLGNSKTPAVHHRQCSRGESGAGTALTVTADLLMLSWIQSFNFENLQNSYTVLCSNTNKYTQISKQICKGNSKSTQRKQESNSTPLPKASLLLLLLSHFSRVRLCVTPEKAAHQAPLSLEFSKQEHWSGPPFPSLMHESEKWKWSRSVVSDS